MYLQYPTKQPSAKPSVQSSQHADQQVHGPTVEFHHECAQTVTRQDRRSPQNNQLGWATRPSRSHPQRRRVPDGHQRPHAYHHTSRPTSHRPSQPREQHNSHPQNSHHGRPQP
eukprot:CCRYP_020562-RB/>CCRYP_020562-RB protein AED:0.53 eAED:1.00 QI:0/0/0/0.5/0/0/2/0/112